MSISDSTSADQAMRAIVARLLRERPDATPSDIVELLGDYVIWGPIDPGPGCAETPEPFAVERASVAA